MSNVAGYTLETPGTLFVRLPGGGRRPARPPEVARFWRSAPGIALAAAMAEVEGKGTRERADHSPERAAG